MLPVPKTQVLIIPRPSWHREERMCDGKPKCRNSSPALEHESLMSLNSNLSPRSKESESRVLVSGWGQRYWMKQSGYPGDGILQGLSPVQSITSLDLLHEVTATDVENKVLGLQQDHFSEVWNLEKLAASCATRELLPAAGYIQNGWSFWSFWTQLISIWMSKGQTDGQTDTQPKSGHSLKDLMYSCSEMAQYK